MSEETYTGKSQGVLPLYGNMMAQGLLKSKPQKSAEKKRGAYDHSEELLKELGLLPEDESERITLPQNRPSDYMVGGGMMGTPVPGMYGGVPTGVQSMPMGSPYMGMPMMGGQMMPMYGAPQTGLEVRYTSSDGTTYTMGVQASPKNKQQAFEKVLGGLYALVMSDGKYEGKKD